MLDKLKILYPFITPREDWRNASAYPNSHSTDATEWGWEFLRRCSYYEKQYENFLTDRALSDEFSTAWNISRMVSPKLNYSALRKEDQELNNLFEFVGTKAHIGFPFYSNDESSKKVFLNKNYLLFPPACELSLIVASNEVVVKICVDGDIDKQLDSVRAQLRKPANETYAGRATRRISFEVNPPKGHIMEEGETFVLAFEYERQPIKVRLSHLWLALRCADAFCELKKRAMKPRMLLDMIHEQLKNELNCKRTEVEKFVAEGKSEWTKSELDDAMHFAIRYVLLGKSVTVASTDLVAQHKGFRKKTLKKIWGNGGCKEFCVDDFFTRLPITQGVQMKRTKALNSNTASNPVPTEAAERPAFPQALLGNVIAH